jgi:uncharacterized protein with HEPN domain
MSVASARVIEYVRGMSREEFYADQRTVDAVIRNLEIIGEAASHLALLRPQPLESVNLGRMKAMRNVLAHRYFGIDRDILWDVIDTHVPALREALRREMGDQAIDSGSL